MKLLRSTSLVALVLTLLPAALPAMETLTDDETVAACIFNANFHIFCPYPVAEYVRSEHGSFATKLPAGVVKGEGKGEAGGRQVAWLKTYEAPAEADKSVLCADISRAYAKVYPGTNAARLLIKVDAAGDFCYFIRQHSYTETFLQQCQALNPTDKPGLALAYVLYAHFMLLDHPTDDLEIDPRNVYETAKNVFEKFPTVLAILAIDSALRGIPYKH